MRIKKKCCAALALIFCAVGCSKEQREELSAKMSQAKEQVSSSAQSVTNQAADTLSQAKEQVVADGEATFKVDKEISFGASYINLIKVKDRGSVIQIRSYSEPTTERFPAYFFQANSSSNSLNAVSGQTITGTLFIKRGPNDMTLASLVDQPISISLGSIADGKLSGKVIDGRLSGGSGEPIAVTGSFEAIIQGGLE